MKDRQQQLVKLIENHTNTDGTIETEIDKLGFIRSSSLSEPLHSLFEPSVCFIAQGSKIVMVGDDIFHYDPNHYLIASVHLPITGKIIKATEDKPYLGVKLRFTTEEILDVIKVKQDHSAPAQRAIMVNETTANILDAVIRLISLLDTPEDIPALAPLYKREILYRIWQREDGEQMREFAVMGSQAQAIKEVIQTINEEFDQPLRIDVLAKMAKMSVSSFHHYFKQVTSLSPLKYQKKIRLQEARKLLMSEPIEAAEAAFQVGYESPSQFSREYSRMFGYPPVSDVKRLRDSLTNSAEKNKK